MTGAVAGMEQASNTFAGYGQGAQGYGKRFGANYADGFTDNMIGGAILPSLFKQDPRYFYKGTGTHSVARDVRHCECGHLQGRQRALAAELLRDSGRDGGRRHLEPLLPGQRPQRRGADL